MPLSLSSWRTKSISTIFLLAMAISSYSFAPTTRTIATSLTTKRAHKHNHQHLYTIPSHQDHDIQTSYSSSTTSSRRQILQTILLSTTATTTLPLLPSYASSSPEQQQEGQFTPTQISLLLSSIPTYTLVEYPTGIPYAVVGEDAKLTSYFFTTYEEANRILTLAINSAEKARKELRGELKKKGKKREEIEEEVGVNPWEKARISAVPLDFAVTLVFASKEGRTRRSNMYFKVAPAEKDVEEALSLSSSSSSNKKELEEGKVPLFYFEDFSFQEENGGNKKSPLYFSKEELIAEWNKQNKGKGDMPEVKVTELFAVLTEMVNPQNTDPDLKSLYFVPPKDSVKKAKQCKVKNEKEGLDSPFVIGQRIVVL